ncbi:MAG: ABC transporter ATP-binding protein [Anaerolineae bacterium]|nr:ABC transporter ATP-binding protein [Anaerolineae bacterium]MDW8299599.1 ABC transporter ATP-binding protein [Anaerolineae bacterium]
MDKIVAEEVTIRYADRSGIGEVTAVQDVSFSVAEGEFVCLVGPSGCGKTSLLRAIAGLQPISSGTLYVQRSNEQRPATAMVFQGAAVFPWMTVLENVSYGLRTRGMSYAQQIAIAREWIARVKLERFAEAYPYQLSGGMQQRVGLARAFAYNAEVLLMDEPFAALDAQTRLILQDTLLELWQASGSTVIFVTHSIDEALTLADRLLVMSARPGHILSDERVELPRPRDAVTLRSDPHYGELFGKVWSLLRQQVA